jgi:hydroxylamine reductase
MFCFQCEQTAKGEGCTKIGVCGKQPDVAELQDLLVYAVKGLSLVAEEARRHGISDPEINRFTVKALFSTLTNVDFDPERFVELIHQCTAHRESLKKKVATAGGKTDFPDKAAEFTPAKTRDELITQGEQVGVRVDADIDEDVRSLRETLIYGIKGMCAYADHAEILGQTDETVYAFIHRAMAATLDKTKGVPEFFDLCMECGQPPGHGAARRRPTPAPTATPSPPRSASPLGAKKGKAILVSGHDLKDLETCCSSRPRARASTSTPTARCCPATATPELKKYKHFWSATTAAPGRTRPRNSRLPRRDPDDHQLHPEAKETYKDRIFTTGLVGWPGVSTSAPTRISRRSSRRPWPARFPEDVPGKTSPWASAATRCWAWPTRSSRRSRRGKIRHFFLVGGCDGAKPGRNYYTEFVEKVPSDCVILTLACGKFRFNKDSATSAASRGCSTSASATTPTRPSRSPWPWRAPSTAASTTCRCP